MLGSGNEPNVTKLREAGSCRNAGPSFLHQENQDSISGALVKKSLFFACLLDRERFNGTRKEKNFYFVELTNFTLSAMCNITAGSR